MVPRLNFEQPSNDDGNEIESAAMIQLDGHLHRDALPRIALTEGLGV